MRRFLRFMSAVLAALMTLTGCSVSRTPALRDYHPSLVAHAGGAIYGYCYTNTLDALESSYNAGHRFIELDFDRTSDGEIVLIHSWLTMVKRLLGRDGVLTYDEFKNSPVFLNLTMMDLGDLIIWLQRHPDASVITDTKDGDNAAMLREIAARAGGLTNNFIPQIYDFSEYDVVREIGYDRIIFTTYRSDADAEDIARFVREKRPWAVTVAEEALTEELLQTLSAAGAAVYCHSVNTLAFYEEWMDRGLTGIYTDYFQPAHWPYEYERKTAQ